MKRNIYYFLLAVTLFTACTKDDGPVKEAYGIQRTQPQPQIKKTGGSQAIDVLNLGTFSAEFTVGLYRAGDAPAKMDIVIRKGGLNVNTKVYKAAVTTFPTTFTLTAADLATLFGNTVLLNDSYDISADYYDESGRKFEAFPIVPGDANKAIFGYNSGVTGQFGASLLIQYRAICAYDPAIYEGNFVVVEDEWADYLPGDVVELTRGTNDTISFIHVAAVNPIPVKIAVNRLDNSAKVNKQFVGTRWAYGAIYTGPFILTGGSPASSFVSPCDKEITLALDYGYSAGTFGGGPYKLVLVKQ